MGADLEQLTAIAALGGAVLVLLAVAFLIARSVRDLFRWIAGAKTPKGDTGPVRSAGTALLPHLVSASDLYAVRANLDAVSRQLADLEAKLRLASAAPPRHG